MKLGFFTMPMHPPGRNYTQTLKEDREAFILADQLGYAEALVGEHVSDICESIPSSLAFLASLAHETKQIKLGTGTVNLTNSHPAQVASLAAMVDHMLEGRFIFGIGPGGLRSDMEVFDNIDKDRNAMFLESINHILALWSGTPPYELTGMHWNISTQRTLIPETGQGIFLKPYQQPHPPIVVTAITPSSKGITAAAQRGWKPLSANFLQSNGVATHWPMYEQGCSIAGLPALRADWRVCKSIFVADDDATAERYVKDHKGAYGFYFWNLYTKRKSAKALFSFKRDQAMPDEEVTLDYILDTMVIRGSVNSMVEQLLAFNDELGGFGTLMYCGHDWADPALARRSMQLMAEQVMPRVNAALGES